MKPNAQTAAICGLFCGACPSYPEQCHGCLSDKLTASCTICPNGFRACAQRHHVTRCFECDHFPCERLQNFSTKHWENGICHHAQVIADLKDMKENGVDAWVERQTKRHTCPCCGRLIPWYEHRCPCLAAPAHGCAK